MENVEILHLSYYKNKQKVISYGMTFADFITCLNRKIDNILVLSGGFLDEGFSGFDFTTRCEYSSGKDIFKFIEEDVSSYGDFKWVDFNNKVNLERLTPIEVAELLYLGKLSRPIKTPFNKNIDNRFAYLAHDDGTYNEIYYKNISEYLDVISNFIRNRIGQNLNSKLSDIDYSEFNTLVELSESGIVIDFDKIVIDGNSIKLPLVKVGLFTDMDKMIDFFETNRSELDFKSLILKRSVNSHNCSFRRECQ